MAKRGRGRDLAGLAALGALGYMLTRKQDGSAVPVEDRVGAPVERVRAESAVTAPAAPEALAAPAAPAAPEAVPVRSVAAPKREEPVSAPRLEMPEQTVARVGADAMSKGRRAPAPRRNVAGDYTRKMGATAEEIAAYRNREVKPPSMTPEMRKKGGEFTLRKKGGVVKAKKMASGGATSSASKRGDGIATKGKTKCKMY